MKKLGDIIKDYQPSRGARSERAEIVGYFHERIMDRKGKPYSPAFIAMKLAHLTIRDLYYLKSVCNQAKNFQKIFWWSITVKPVQSAAPIGSAPTASTSSNVSSQSVSAVTK